MGTFEKVKVLYAESFDEKLFLVSFYLLTLTWLPLQKENKNGTMSPESPEPDDSYTLTPRTEAKYNKIDEDFQMMMQRNQQLASNRMSGGGNYTLPVSVPVNSYSDANMLQASPQMAHQNISPRPSSSETDSGENLKLLFHFAKALATISFVFHHSLSIWWYA